MSFDPRDTPPASVGKGTLPLRKGERTSLLVVSALAMLIVAVLVHGSLDLLRLKQAVETARIELQGTTAAWQLNAWPMVADGLPMELLLEAEVRGFSLIRPAGAIPRSRNEVLRGLNVLAGSFAAALLGAALGTYCGGWRRWRAHGAPGVGWLSAAGRSLPLHVLWSACRACMWAPLLAPIVWYVSTARSTDRYDYLDGFPEGPLALGIGATLLAAAGALEARRRWRRFVVRVTTFELRCAACGYPSGVPGARRCPECGAQEPAKLERPRPGNARFRVAVIMAVAGILGFGLLVMRALSPQVSDRAVAWAAMRSVDPSGGQQVALVRPDEILIIRWDDGVGALRVERPPDLDNQSHSSPDPASVHARYVTCFWPRRAAVPQRELVSAADPSAAGLSRVFSGCETMAPGETRELVLPVGAHRVEYAWQPSRWPNELVTVRMYGARDLLRVTPGRGQWLELDLARRLAAIDCSAAAGSEP